MSFPSGFVGVRVRVEGAGPAAPKAPVPDAAEEAAPPADAGRCAVLMGDLKETQRKAFERGRELERQESGEALRSAAALLAQVATEHREARVRDTLELEDFAVKLSLCVAEVVVGRVLSEESHDVRDLARKILDEALGPVPATEAVLYAGSHDAARISPYVEAIEGPVALRVEVDRELLPGDFRVRAGDVEYASSVQQRLDSVREQLLQEMHRERHA